MADNGIIPGGIDIAMHNCVSQLRKLGARV
jgi:hypothetical protein